MLSPLTNQIAVVTGAGRGIGRAIALKFAQAGADIVCVSRTAANVEKVVGEIRGAGQKAWGHAVDVADAAAVAAISEQILTETGQSQIVQQHRDFIAAMMAADDGTLPPIVEHHIMRLRRPRR